MIQEAPSLPSPALMPFLFVYILSFRRYRGSEYGIEHFFTVFHCAFRLDFSGPDVIDAHYQRLRPTDLCQFPTRDLCSPLAVSSSDISKRSLFHCNAQILGYLFFRALLLPCFFPQKTSIRYFGP